MKILLIAGCACVLAAALSGCAGFTVPGVTGNAGANAMGSLPAQFLTDPNCSHHDEATLVTGAAGMPASFQVKLMRDCQARPAAPTVAAVVGSPAAAPVTAPAQ